MPRAEQIAWSIVSLGFVLQLVSAFTVAANTATPDGPLYSAMWVRGSAWPSVVFIVGGLYLVTRTRRLRGSLCFLGLFSVFGLYKFLGELESSTSPRPSDVND